MAFIFLGLSHQEIGQADEALKSFRKAVKLKPDPLLAWSGLVNFYEKIDNENKEELLHAYIELVKLER